MLYLGTSPQAERRREQSGVRDDGVILAAFAAGVDAKPPEFREAIFRERTAEPRRVQKLCTRGDYTCLGARFHPLVKEKVSRESPERFHRRDAAPLAHAVRPQAVLLKQNVAEDDVGDAPARGRF